MPSFNLFSGASAPASATTTDPSSSSPPSSTSTLPPDHPPVPAGADACPVDHTTRSKWLAATSSDSSASAPHPLTSPANPSPGRPRPGALGTDRVISSIPRAATSYPSSEGSVPYPASASGGGSSSGNAVEVAEGKGKEEKWVYPSEAQFFSAMQRKNHKPRQEDMRTVVPIHNAVNEKAWEEVLMWEAGMGGEKCGGPRLISFSGRPKDLTPKAWAKTLVGYAAPFDRHDWLVDRCGKQVRYVIDFYSGRRDPAQPERMAFYLDVRPALDDWDGVRTRWAGLWK